MLVRQQFTCALEHLFMLLFMYMRFYQAYCAHHNLTPHSICACFQNYKGNIKPLLLVLQLKLHTFYPSYCVSYNISPHSTCTYFQHYKGQIKSLLLQCRLHTFYPAYCVCYNMAPHSTCASFQHYKARLANCMYFHHPCCVCYGAKNRCPVI